MACKLVPASRLLSSATPRPTINFADTKTAYESKSMFQLVRSWMVFKLCGQLQ